MKMFKVENTEEGLDAQAPRVVIAKGPASAVAHVSRPLQAAAINAMELHDLQQTWPDLIVETAGEE